MSNESAGGVPNVDNLTPFEYTLAGVPVPEGQDTPSLGFIKEMRQLASDVQDAPVSQPRLREFLQNGGSIGRRSDRRAIRTRRSAAANSRPAPRMPDEGGFVDITPIEMTDDGMLHPQSADLAVNTDHTTRSSIAGAATVVGAAGLAAAAAGALGDPTAESSTPDLAHELPNASVDADADAADAVAVDVDAVDATTSGPDVPEAIAAEGAAGPEAQFEDEPEGAVGSDQAPPEVVSPVLDETAAVDAESADLDDIALTTIEGGESEDGLLTLDDGSTVSMSSLATAPAFQDEPVDRGLFDSADPFNPADNADQDVPSRLFPNVEDGPGFQTVAVGFDDVAAEPPLIGDQDVDDEGAVLVASVSGAAAGVAEPGILDQGEGHEDSDGPMASIAAPTASVPIQKRRLGGAAFWALTATAVVAAALAVGGIWWAGGLGDRTEAETAAPRVSTTTTINDTAAGAPGSVADGTADDPGDDEAGDNSSKVGQLRSPTTDSDSETTASSAPGTTTGTTEAAVTTVDTSRNTGSDSTTAATTAIRTTNTTNTTQATTTAPTNPTTAQPTSPSTNVPQTTAAPRPQPGPTSSTTTGPAPLAYIGDSVNIGAYSGPPASGALVALFDDDGADGQPDALNQTRFTDGAGRFSFNVPAGCYVVRFYPIDNHTIDPNLEYQPICLEPGEAKPRIDAIVYPIQRVSAPASGCTVEPNSFGADFQGVEVYENQSNWADSYTFFRNDGSVVARTADLGPADDVEGSTNREWVGFRSGFNVRSVWRIAAERNGMLSQQITCSR